MCLRVEGCMVCLLRLVNIMYNDNMYFLVYNELFSVNTFLLAMLLTQVTRNLRFRN